MLPFMAREGDGVWTSFFNVTAHAPNVAYLSVTVNDVSGNNNGILDPGETAPVVITLQEQRHRTGVQR